MQFCTYRFASSHVSPPSSHSRATTPADRPSAHQSHTRDTVSTADVCNVNGRKHAMNINPFLSSSPGQCFGCGAPWKLAFRGRSFRTRTHLWRVVSLPGTSGNAAQLSHPSPRTT
eukprot:1924662-Pyramimonas_sp.AAC.1